MALKIYKPITAGTRTRIDLRRDELTTDKPEKSLTSGLKSNGGRGAKGRISVRHQGGGHKRKYRVSDFIPILQPSVITPAIWRSFDSIGIIICALTLTSAIILAILCGGFLLSSYIESAR